MLCKCHGEPSYWATDPRKRKGGYWTCAVKRREHARRMYAKSRDQKLARQRGYYHSPEGGWLVRRRRDLAGERARILARLAELKEDTC